MGMPRRLQYAPSVNTKGLNSSGSGERITTSKDDIERQRVDTMLGILPYYIQSQLKVDPSSPVLPWYRAIKSEGKDPELYNLVFDCPAFESMLSESPGISELERAVSATKLTKFVNRLFTIDVNSTSDPLYTFRDRNSFVLFREVLKANKEGLYGRMKKNLSGIKMKEVEKI